MQLSKGKLPVPTPDWVVKKLTDPALLQRWGAYSLKTRMSLCMTELQYPVGYRELRRIYKSANVRYIRT